MAIQEKFENLLKSINERLQQIESNQNALLRNIKNNEKLISETIFAHIFFDATRDSKWLKSKTFYPGRWAIGYPAMYVLYRVLNEAKPKNILELGLGNSTRLIAQYAEHHSDVHHIVVESNPDWIKFFSADFHLSTSTEIKELNYTFTSYKEAEKVRVYDGFSESFSGKKFNLICIDAPLGYDMKRYSRIDIISILPKCLDNDFVIMLDDYNRSGEKRTIQEILKILKNHKIPVKTHAYVGAKAFYLICSESLGWLATM